MRRLLLALALVLLGSSAWAAKTEVLTVSNTPIGITAGLCDAGPSGVVIEVLTNNIFYTLHDPAATPDSTGHELDAGGLLNLAEPFKFRAIRNGGSDATLRVSCVTGTQETRVLKPASGGAGSLTDTQLRATPVPVSGTVTANAGSGTFNNQQSNKTADFDTGAGTDTVTMYGLALPKSGGAVAGGTSTDPIRVDPTGTTTQPVSGTVTANQGTANATPWNENIAQINGVTPLMGAGNTGTGSPRVTIASDNAPLTVRGANSNAIISCDNNAKLNMTTATTTEIVAISGSTTIYVCSYSIIVSAATNVKFVRGTGTNCATGTTDVSSNMHFTPSVATTTIGVTRGSGVGMILKGAASGALCVTSSAAVNVDVDIAFAQF